MLDIVFLPRWREHPNSDICSLVLARRAFLLTAHVRNETMRASLSHIAHDLAVTPPKDLVCPPWEKEELLIPLIVAVAMCIVFTLGPPVLSDAYPRWLRICELGWVTAAPCAVALLAPAMDAEFELLQALTVAAIIFKQLRWGFLHGIIYFGQGGSARKRMRVVSDPESLGGPCVVCHEGVDKEALVAHCGCAYHSRCADRWLSVSAVCFECKKPL
jgi:hypothetical protein